MNTNFPSRITAINSRVLIEALRNSPDILKEFGYKLVSVTDVDSNTESSTPPPLATLCGDETAPPLTDESAQNDEQIATSANSDGSSASDATVVHKREYSEKEKQILTAARKSYQREMQCGYDMAKKYVAEHAEEYIAAHYAELTGSKE